jgi:putative transposase
VKFAFIAAESAEFPVNALCRVVGVTRQGYYAWVARKPSSREQSDRELEQKIRAAHEASHGTYGSPRIRKALAEADTGVRVSKRRVERLMRAEGLCGCQPKRFRRTTVNDPSHAVAPNTLDRGFTVQRPNQAWVADITYVQTATGWSYVAVILDLFSRSVVGWAVDTSMTTELVMRALHMALLRRDPPVGLLHHSDRGCQYTSHSYQRALAEGGIVASMSRKGNCWDNAVAESFFSTLKTELVDRETWPSHGELRAALFEYIEVFYNRQRLHSTLGYITPARADSNYHAATAA